MQSACVSRVGAALARSKDMDDPRPAVPVRSAAAVQQCSLGPWVGFEQVSHHGVDEPRFVLLAIRDRSQVRRGYLDPGDPCSPARQGEFFLAAADEELQKLLPALPQVAFAARSRQVVPVVAAASYFRLDVVDVFADGAAVRANVPPGSRPANLVLTSRPSPRARVPAGPTRARFVVEGSASYFARVDGRSRGGAQCRRTCAVVLSAWINIGAPP